MRLVRTRCDLGIQASSHLNCYNVTRSPESLGKLLGSPASCRSRYLLVHPTPESHGQSSPPHSFILPPFKRERKKSGTGITLVNVFLTPLPTNPPPIAVVSVSPASPVATAPVSRSTVCSAYTIKKAYTSRAFDIATKDLATHSQSGGQFFGIHVSNDGKIMIFAGGIPLKRNGRVVGAIGVSGGSGDQDHAVAEAGAASF
jgi:uncharacterized protein GlcG (DUF336 family)